MKPLILAFFSLALVFGSSCGKIDKATPSIAHVVVSIPPYLFLVKEIAGATMTVSSALGTDFDPHTAEITPRQMKTVQNADLFIGVGEGYEKKLLVALREGKKEISILEIDQKLPLLSYSTDTHCIDACELTDSKDLHFWLSPKHLIIQVKLLIQALSQLKPENSALYSSNGHVLIEKIKALDTRLEDKLHLFKKKAILVSHPSLGYFCHDYNLIQIAVECEGKSPRPQNISRVYDLARHSDVICVFTAPQFNNKGAEMVADELNLRVESFNPLEEDVLTTIEKIASDIVK